MGYIKRGLIPNLISNTSDPNFIIKSNSIFGYNDAFKAFDGNINDCYISNTNNSDENIYIEIDMSQSCYICGLKITSRATTPVLNGDYKLFLSNDGISWKETLSVSTQSTPNTDKEVMFYPKRCKYIKLEGLTRDVQLAIGALQFYLIEEFYVIKQDGKYYSFNEEQYNQETKMFNEVTLEQINTTTNNNYLSEKSYLTQVYSIGDETFRPIDKFGDEIQLVSIEKRDININGIKSKKEMITANGDINVNIAENIDFFKGEYEIPEGCSIKVAVSTDKGETWKTSNDNGISWENITLDKNEISNNGIDLASLQNVNFNTLFENEDSDRLIRLVYVISIDSVTDCNTSKLEWQFDAKGKFRQLSKEEAVVELSQSYISITPSKNMDMMQVNVGTGGNLTVNEITNNNAAESVTEEEISDMMKEVLQ